MIKIDEIICFIDQALRENNSILFAESINSFLDSFDSLKYGKNNRLWEMFVGYESTWCPSLKRTSYQQMRRRDWEKGTFSYENKTKVLAEGEDILAALDRAKSWREGYSYWDKHTCESHIELRIFCMEKDGDELTKKISIPTGPQCKATLLATLKEHFEKAAEKLSDIQKAREIFDDSKYDFNKPITDYSAWVAKFVPIILKNNGYDGKKSFYEGISIRDAKCDFWTGHVHQCTPTGLIVWVGGDSTDDENWITYQEWSSRKEYYWRSEHAEVSARISVQQRQEMSKKIFNLILNRCRDGKLK